jgi:ABC-type sulfate/molybdate transport systems ATPase subunit
MRGTMSSARQRVRAYLIEYARMRHLDQEYIHSLNPGSDREAALSIDDLRVLLAAADRLALLDEERS